MALLEKRKKLLADEGLFSENLKKDIPYLPRVIGVITSPTGSVIRDIIHRISDRFPVHIIVWPVRVQGETCPDEVVDACLLYTSPSPRDRQKSRMPSSA